MVLVLLAIPVVGGGGCQEGWVGCWRVWQHTGLQGHWPSNVTGSLAAGWLEAVVVVLLMVAVVVPVARILTVEVTDAVDSLHRQLIHKYNSG